MSLTRDALDKDLPPEAEAACWNRALWHLSRKDFGEQELRQKLLRRPPGKPCPLPPTVDAVVARLRDFGYLNDARYAERLAEQLSRRGYAARGVAQILRQRGICEDVELPQSDAERLQDLLQTKFAARLHTEPDRRRVYNALVRKGFGPADIRRAMRDFDEGEWENADF